MFECLMPWPSDPSLALDRIFLPPSPPFVLGTCCFIVSLETSLLPWATDLVDAIPNTGLHGPHSVRIALQTCGGRSLFLLLLDEQQQTFPSENKARLFHASAPQGMSSGEGLLLSLLVVKKIISCKDKGNKRNSAAHASNAILVSYL